MKPRILVFDTSVAVTGGLRGATRMARLLADIADVDLVLPTENQVPSSELAHFGSVFRIPYRPLRKSLRSAAAYLPSLARSSEALNLVLKRQRYHALILNDFFVPHGWLARRSGFTGRIVTWVRFDPLRFPLALRTLWLMAAKRSDAIVAVSDFVRGRLPASLEARLIYDSVDLDLPLGRQPGSHSDVVCVGNYIRDKGQADVLAAFAAIAPRFPRVRLAFYGGDMALDKNRIFHRELEERARALGLGDRVRFNDFAADLRPVFAKAAVALNLSRSETFSLTCLEAQQSGIPVISYDSGGPAEIVADCETGYLCQVGDVACAADRMAELLASPDRAEAFGAAAAKHVAAKFDPADFVSRVRAVLAV